MVCRSAIPALPLLLAGAHFTAHAGMFSYMAGSAPLAPSLVGCAQQPVGCRAPICLLTVRPAGSALAAVVQTRLTMALPDCLLLRFDWPVGCGSGDSVTAFICRC